MKENIFASSVVVIGFLVVFVIIYYIISFKNIAKSKKYYEELHKSIVVGKNIEFCGGIYGKITKVQEDYIDVEISKGTVIKVSRYAITKVLDK